MAIWKDGNPHSGMVNPGWSLSEHSGTVLHASCTLSANAPTTPNNIQQMPALTLNKWCKCIVAGACSSCGQHPSAASHLCMCILVGVACVECCMCWVLLGVDVDRCCSVLLAVDGCWWMLFVGAGHWWVLMDVVGFTIWFQMIESFAYEYWSSPDGSLVLVVMGMY